MTQTAVPAGWYQDPYDARSLRWWDGARWTEHAQAAPPPAPAPQPAPAYAQAPAAPAYAQPQQQIPHQQQYVPPQQPVPQHQTPHQQPYPPQQPVPPQSVPPQQPVPPQSVPPQSVPPQQPAPAYAQAPAAPANPFPPAAMPKPYPQQAGAPGYAPQPVAGGGAEALLSAPVLKVNQNFKWVDVTTSYAVLDRDGNPLGSVAEVGQNAARKALRFMSSMDKYLSRSFEIRDAAGVPFLVLGRGTKVIKSRVTVTRPDGSPVGEIVQDSVIGRISFDLVAGGYPVGKLTAEDWFSFSFSISDHTGTEVARITRDVVGLAVHVIGGDDFYYVHFGGPVAEPLRSLAIGAALTVNTLLKPDTHGNE